MNEIDKIEGLLRKAPRVKVPGGLRERLQAEIVLPRAPVKEAAGQNWRTLLRRWLPVLSFSAFFLACVVAIAVQSSLLSELRRENESLKASSQDLAQLRQENSEYQKLRAEHQLLERMRTEKLELQRLQNEIVQLRQTLREMPALQAEHQRLLAQKKLTDRGVPSGSPQEEDPFGAAVREPQRIRCLSNLKQIGLAARMWSSDHKNILPTDFITMSNELSAVIALVCPGDTNRTAALRWSEFGPANVSYEMLSPGASEMQDPHLVYLRCPIHNNVEFVDGRAQMLSPGVKLIQKKDGKWVIREGD